MPGAVCRLQGAGWQPGEWYLQAMLEQPHLALQANQGPADRAHSQAECFMPVFVSMTIMLT
jgi:hypothetical protein